MSDRTLKVRNRTRNWTTLDNAAVLDSNLSLKAKGLLLVMMSRPADWKFYMSWLEKQSADGKDAHASAMQELEARGYVAKERLHDEKGRFAGYEYVVSDIPMELEADSTITGKTGNGLSENGKTVNGKPATTKEDRTKEDFTKENTTHESVSVQKNLGSGTPQNGQGQPAPSLGKPGGTQGSAGTQTTAVQEVPGPDVATTKLLNTAFGQRLQGLLDDPMAPLNVDRMKWFNIPETRAESLRQQARQAAAEKRTNVRTEFIHLLDQEVEERVIPRLSGNTSTSMPATITLPELPSLPDIDEEDDCL